MFRPGGRKTFGDFDPVDAVDPREILGDGCGFVALNRADEMPNDRQIARRQDFDERFLQITFAEFVLPGLKGPPNGDLRHAFADSQ